MIPRERRGEGSIIKFSLKKKNVHDKESLSKSKQSLLSFKNLRMRRSNSFLSLWSFENYALQQFSSQNIKRIFKMYDNFYIYVKKKKKKGQDTGAKWILFTWQLKGTTCERVSSDTEAAMLLSENPSGPVTRGHVLRRWLHWTSVSGRCREYKVERFPPLRSYSILRCSRNISLSSFRVSSFFRVSVCGISHS